jgi:adenine-specific DNA-methyltransferase
MTAEGGGSPKLTSRLALSRWWRRSADQTPNIRVLRLRRHMDFCTVRRMPTSRPQQVSLWDESNSGEPARSRPTESAYWRGSIASRSQSREDQRKLGQYMTPPPIARLIARRMVEGRPWGGRVLRVLDPAAGSGVLAAALIEAIAALPAPPASIELLMCDLDPAMQPLLERCATELKALCSDVGLNLMAHVQQGDFLLSALARDALPLVDAVIANPPYFKLARNDERVIAHEHSVYGQPNIYALFMSSCAAILRPGGAYGFITPRSWTNGAYFSATRRVLRQRLSVDALHVFDSRQAHFEDDAVLQEALILWGTASQTQADVLVSTSHGIADIDARTPVAWPAERVVGHAPDDTVVLPSCTQPGDLDHWPLRFADIGLRVLTGPVVGFRARAHLCSHPSSTNVPMLWMPHVRRSHIDWPRQHKTEHIESNADSAWMLLPNEPMVLLRRFSPKEDERRITAAPYEGQLPGARIGLENHLNVIRGADGPMSIDVARGLAAWLNSRPVDEHLRQRLGSTQVNAVELRSLPVPDIATLAPLGRDLSEEPTLEHRVSGMAHGARAA